MKPAAIGAPSAEVMTSAMPNCLSAPAPGRRPDASLPLTSLMPPGVVLAGRLLRRGSAFFALAVTLLQTICSTIRSGLTRDVGRQAGDDLRRMRVDLWAGSPPLARMPNAGVIELLFRIEA